MRERVAGARAVLKEALGDGGSREGPTAEPDAKPNKRRPGSGGPRRPGSGSPTDITDTEANDFFEHGSSRRNLPRVSRNTDDGEFSAEITRKGQIMVDFPNGMNDEAQRKAFVERALRALDVKASSEQALVDALANGRMRSDETGDRVFVDRGLNVADPDSVEAMGRQLIADAMPHRDDTPTAEDFAGDCEADALAVQAALAKDGLYAPVIMAPDHKWVLIDGDDADSSRIIDRTGGQFGEGKPVELADGNTQYDPFMGSPAQLRARMQEMLDRGLINDAAFGMVRKAIKQGGIAGDPDNIGIDALMQGLYGFLEGKPGEKLQFAGPARMIKSKGTAAPEGFQDPAARKGADATELAPPTRRRPGSGGLDPDANKGSSPKVDQQSLREINDMDELGLQQRLIAQHGIGPKTAAKLAKLRPFASYDDLQEKVSGVGPKRSALISEGMSGRAELHNHQGGVFTPEDTITLLGANAGPDATPLQQSQHVYESIRNVRDLQTTFNTLMAEAGMEKLGRLTNRDGSLTEDGQRIMDHIEANRDRFPDHVHHLLDAEHNAIFGMTHQRNQITEPVQRILDEAPENASKEWYDQQITRMLIAGEVPFNEAYNVRRALFASQDYDPVDGMRVLLQRLKKQGADYVELQGGLGKDFPPETLARLCAETGVEVRFLSVVSSRSIWGASETSMDAQGVPTKMRKAIDNVFDGQHGGFVVGLDYAGPERSFTGPGGEHFLASCRYMRDRIEQGGEAVMRVHVGEGYFADADDRSGEIDRARKNVQALIDAVTKLRQDDTAESGTLQIRAGHCTHATPEQIKQLKALGVHIEANIGSNLATGAINDISEHPLLAMLYHDADMSLNTDAGGVMATSLDQEYEHAADIIEGFKAGMFTLTIDGEQVFYDDLDEDTKKRFSTDHLAGQSRRHGRLGRDAT